LQFVEITAPTSEELDLIAVYRNHDFIEKALGNFVGLARLLRFICRSTNNAVGSVICHSIHAYANNKSRLLRMLDTSE
jgi:thymidylate synthase